MKSIILFALIAVALLGAVPANAAAWYRPRTDVGPGPVWIPGASATVTAQDTLTLIASDTVLFSETTGQVVRYNEGDTITFSGDTYYEIAGGGWDTAAVSGFYGFSIECEDTAVVVNFKRMPLDITDGEYLGAGEKRDFDLQTPIVFIRTATGLPLAGHPECVRIRGYR